MHISPFAGNLAEDKGIKNKDLVPLYGSFPDPAIRKLHELPSQNYPTGVKNP
jgi:hypothetical protein